jgi:hypothetical protein
MTRGRTRSPKGTLWRGYRRPVLRDGVFWFAVLVGLCGTAMQSPLSGFEGTTGAWVILMLQFGLTTIAALVLVGVIAATFRGFGDGWRVAGAAQRAEKPVKAERPENAPPAATPKAAAPDLVAEAEPGSEARPSPTPAGADRPAVGIKMEHRARAFGRAFGAARRTYRDSD